MTERRVQPNRQTSTFVFIQERLCVEACAHAHTPRLYRTTAADILRNLSSVEDVLIKTTKTLCVEQARLLQVPSGHVSGMQLCDAYDGAVLRFSDVALQANIDRMLMKGSRDPLKNALMRARKTP